MSLGTLADLSCFLAFEMDGTSASPRSHLPSCRGTVSVFGTFWIVGHQDWLRLDSDIIRGLARPSISARFEW